MFLSYAHPDSALTDDEKIYFNVWSNASWSEVYEYSNQNIQLLGTVLRVLTFKWFLACDIFRR